MKRISLVLRLLRSKPLISTVVLLIVLVGGYFVFFSSGPVAKTLVITRGEFLQQVSVSGKVKAAQDIDLGFSQGGRVANVYTRVGQYVAAGAILAEVENGDLRAARDAEQSKLASLQAGTRPEQIAVYESTVAQNKSALLQSNTALLDAVGNAYTASDSAIHNTLDQFITNPTTNPKITFLTKNAEIETTINAERQKIEDVLVVWKTHLAKASATGDLSALVQETQNSVALVIALLADTNNLLNAAIPSGSTSQSIIDGYITAVGTVRTSINTASSAFTSAVGVHKAAGTALDSAEKNLALAMAGSVPEDISAEEARVRGAEADLAKTLILAPFSGIVTVVDAKVGKIVSPNIPEVSMISNGAFQIETYVPEINVALIKVGNPAQVTLDAYGDTVPFTATLVSVDPADTVRDGVSTYRAILQFTVSDPRIKSGMTANVTITTATKQNAIAIPQGLVIDRDGKKYVQVIENKKTSEREVITGDLSSSGLIEILSGLHEGDVLALPQ